MEKRQPDQEPREKRPQDEATEHHRVAARLKGVVKNLGIKPKKKTPKDAA